MRKLVIAVSSLSVFACLPVANAQSSGSTVPQASTAQIKTFPAPAHPVTPEQVREIVELTHMRENMQSSMQHSIDSERKAMPYLPDVFFTDMQKSLAQMDAIGIFQSIYVKYISEEDARGIIAFYKTPAGQNYVNAVPSMMQEVMDTFMAKGMEIGQKIAADHKTEMDDAMKQYQKEHPSGSSAPPPNQ